MTTIEAMMMKCPECEGTGLRTHEHPNDPWARVFECRECGGTEEAVASRECCQRDATEVFDGLTLCAIRAEEQRLDYAIDAVEYRS
jgi:peptide subunit release factor 1 (eRF1)